MASVRQRCPVISGGGPGLGGIHRQPRMTFEKMQRSLQYGLTFLKDLVSDSSMQKVAVQSALQYAVKHGLARRKGRSLYELTLDDKNTAGVPRQYKSGKASTKSKAPSILRAVASSLPAKRKSAVSRVVKQSVSAEDPPPRRPSGTQRTSACESSGGGGGGVGGGRRAVPRRAPPDASVKRANANSSRGRAPDGRRDAGTFGGDAVVKKNKKKNSKAPRKPGVIPKRKGDPKKGTESKGKGKGRVSDKYPRMI